MKLFPIVEQLINSGFTANNTFGKYPFMPANTFSPDNLKLELTKQGVKHPDIALAQAKIESDHFRSPIFKENNNLFGMKLPSSRRTTAIGANRGHAKYKDWVDSVKDYKLWQDTQGFANLDQNTYLQKLSDIYCSPPDCKKGQYGKLVQQVMTQR